MGSRFIVSIVCTETHSKFNDSVCQSRDDNAHSRKNDKKEHGIHNIITTRSYPSRHQRKFAYIYIIWPGSIVRVFFISLRVFLSTMMSVVPIIQ